MPGKFILVPREGAVHAPHTFSPKVYNDPSTPTSVKRNMAGPWCYLYDGQVRSIFLSEGDTFAQPTPQDGLKPRAMDEGEADCALNFFSPFKPGQELEETRLVDKLPYEGPEDEYGVPIREVEAKTTACHECGETVPISELSKHVLAHLEQAGAEDDDSFDDMDRGELAAYLTEHKIDFPATGNRPTLLKIARDSAKQ